LSGKSELFIVNQLLISKGRSLDKIIQVETIESYSGLSKNLGKLAAGQYLAELVLHQALSEQPQEQLFYLLREHLSRLERLSKEDLKLPNLLLAYLAHGIYHLLALDGIGPQVQICCATGRPLRPNLTDSEWRIWFSIDSGGTVLLSALTENERSKTNPALKYLNTQIDAAQLKLLQDLALAELNQEIELTVSENWVLVENLLRQYAQYQLGCSIRSAGLIDTYLEMTSFAKI
jgi:DNA repair protein RecO (recombination protein O)